MNLNDFLSELNLNGRALSISLEDQLPGDNAAQKNACTLSLLQDALAGKTVCFHGGMKGCPGAMRGMGFFDGVPPIKGGFGNFIANGCGEGFPEGERIKQSAEIGEEMLASQPTGVLDGKQYIVVKPLDVESASALVTFLCTPDQLSALIHLFCYRRSDYDSVIAPMSSGCASLFRIPFDESKKENPRAVIGNVDIFSRVIFDKNSFFFTIPTKIFRQMLEDADTSFITAKKWKELHARIR